MSMEQRKVVSSMIETIGYDPKAMTLRIELVGGALYEYHDVPADVYNSLMYAQSRGSYYHAYIREKFDYVKLR